MEEVNCQRLPAPGRGDGPCGWGGLIAEIVGSVDFSYQASVRGTG